MIRIAVDDPGFAVEPGYYQQALNWDAHRAEQQRSANLGWNATWDVSQPATGAGQTKPEAHTLHVSLNDVMGAPLDDASVSVVAFHNARAAETQSLQLHRSTPGQYDARLVVTRSGLWHLRLVAVRGNDRFSEAVTLDFDREGRLLAKAALNPTSTTEAQQ
jgi:nitrogen fixation protein FixH